MGIECIVWERLILKSIARHYRLHGAYMPEPIYKRDLRNSYKRAIENYAVMLRKRYELMIN